MASVGQAPLERMLSTPDFTKTHPQVPNKGAGYCGPAAVSNSLLWLVENGRLNKILSKTDNTPLKQWELVVLLGSNQYMRTETEGGTGASQLVEGLDRFLSTHLKSKYQIAYRGITSVPPSFTSGRQYEQPTLADLRAGLKNNAVAWINAGWYRLNSKSKEYVRIGSSWMTVVGLKEEKGRVKVLLHDPNPRAGEKFSNEEVVLQKLSSGKLVLNGGAISINGDGFFQLAQGMHVKEDASVAILDGIVTLDL